MLNPIKLRRMEKGFKQQEVAELIGIGRTQLANIETNKSLPSALTLLKLIRLLDINIDDLLIYYIKN